MDLTTVRTVIEVMAFVAFCGIVLWAWSGRRRADFDRAAQLPFESPEAPRPPEASRE